MSEVCWDRMVYTSSETGSNLRGGSGGPYRGSRRPRTCSMGQLPRLRRVRVRVLAVLLVEALGGGTARLRGAGLVDRRNP